MNDLGEILDEKDFTCCKVIHDLQRPKICIVMDKVGGNTLKEGDGNDGSKLKVRTTSMVSQQIISTRDKHWSLLWFISLDGDPVMYVLIFVGKIETINCMRLG